MLKPGCKEYFWLLCKLVDNIHIKDASQVRSKIIQLVSRCELYTCMFMTLLILIFKGIFLLYT